MLKIYPLLLMLLAETVIGQTKRIDSLKQRLWNAGNEKDKLSTIFLLCEERQSIPNDTLCKYAMEAGKMTDAPGNLALLLKADYYYNICLLKRSQPEVVIQKCDEVLGGRQRTKPDEW